MKSVLASLKPYWYYLVGEGIKTIEVRKTFPKAEDWSKDTYFYMSRDEKSFAKIPKEFQEKYRKHFGKVGLHFVCDRIYDIIQYGIGAKVFTDNLEIEVEPSKFIEMSCLSEEQIFEYIGNKDGYGWHISNLVIYDKPRELSEFRKDVKDRCTFNDDGVCLGRNQNHVILCDHLDCCQKEIKRPFQSWGYVYEADT